MAWTTPKTWVQDELVNASTMNTHVRDNLAALYSMAAWPARNLLYNGAMQVSQRAAVGAAQTGKNASGYYSADRWNISLTSGGTWSQSVEADAPAGSGLRNSLKMACTTATGALTTNNVATVEQRLEGQDVQRIAKGSASAQPLTVSFWVKSNVTGTYIVELQDVDNTRFVSAAYTITASGTWEQKTVTFPADTTGALDNDANESLRLNFWLVAGTNYTSGTLGTTWHTTTANRVVGTVNMGSANTNTWQLTGVQLETGSVSTPFEFLPFGDELARCQRYFQLATGVPGVGQSGSTTIADVTFALPCEMRAAPVVTAGSGVISVTDTVADFTQSSASVSSYFSSVRTARAYLPNFVGLTALRPLSIKQNSNPLWVSAEL